MLSFTKSLSEEEYCDKTSSKIPKEIYLQTRILEWLKETHLILLPSCMADHSRQNINNEILRPHAILLSLCSGYRVYASMNLYLDLIRYIH